MHARSSRRSDGRAERAGVSYALLGGYAIAAHGYVRFSDDVDILVDPSPENARRWIAALSELPDGAARELAGDDDLFAREGSYAVRINDVFTVAVLPAACGHTWAELAPHIVESIVDGDAIRLLDREGPAAHEGGASGQGRSPAPRCDAVA